MFFNFNYISFESVIRPSLENMLEIVGIWGKITEVETSLEKAGCLLVSLLLPNNFFLYFLHLAVVEYQKTVMSFFTNIQSCPKPGHIH